jgi:hypothetical protein
MRSEASVRAQGTRNALENPVAGQEAVPTP